MAWAGPKNETAPAAVGWDDCNREGRLTGRLQSVTGWAKLVTPGRKSPWGAGGVVES